MSVTDKQRLAREFADLRSACYRVAKDAAYAARIAAYQAGDDPKPPLADVPLDRHADSLGRRLDALRRRSAECSANAKLVQSGFPYPVEDD